MAHSELESRIANDIRTLGAMRFDAFMARALFEPGLGYYARPATRIGRRGDFVTGPGLSPAFGRTLARLVTLVRRCLGEPPSFRVVDAGAGEGDLLAPLLGALPPGPSREGVEAVIVEQSAELRSRASARAREVAGAIAVVALDSAAALSTLPPSPGLVIANELLDAVPVRRFRRGADGSEEAWVDSKAGRLAEIWQPAAVLPPGIAAPGPRERTVAPALDARVGELAGALAGGLVLAIDYGLPACLIDGEEGAGNPVRGFFGGTLVDDLVARPGEVDLTAHVDFTAAHRAGVRAGLDTAFFCDQTYLLLGLGFLDDPAAAAARRLIHPEDLGGAFKCLGLSRGLRADSLRTLGLRDRRNLLER